MLSYNDYSSAFLQDVLFGRTASRRTSSRRTSLRRTALRRTTLRRTTLHREQKSITNARRGLTLLELLVVLTILIALGGIVIASLPGLLEKTQAATAAANVPEIDAAIKRNLLLKRGEIGNRFDSLVIQNGSGKVAGYVGGAPTFQSVALDQDEIAALAELGLTEITAALPTPDNATFDSHGEQPVPISTDTKFCMVSSSQASELMLDLWNIVAPKDAKYLVLGIGQRCTLVGAGSAALFAETPVHFSDSQSSNPSNMYSRYLIVIELKGDSPSEKKARYIGTAIPHRSGLQGIKSQLEEYYSNQ